MPQLGYILIIFAILFLVVWGIIFLFRRPGRLPQISVRRGYTGCFFPIVTSLLVSLALTILLNLLFWLFRC